MLNLYEVSAGSFSCYAVDMHSLREYNDLYGAVRYSDADDPCSFSNLVLEKAILVHKSLS